MSIFWTVIVSPSQAYLCPMNQKTETLDEVRGIPFLGKEWANDPEIKTTPLMGRQILISWPKEKREIKQKLIQCLRQAGIFAQEVQGKKAKQISAGAWILDEAGIPLTKEIYSLLAQTGEDETFSQGIWHIHQSGVSLTQEMIRFLVAKKQQISLAASLIIILHQAGISLTPLLFQLLGSKGLDLSEFVHTAIYPLQKAGIPLTQDLFHFFILHGKHAAQISTAIQILHQGGIPFTREIRPFLEVSTEHAIKISYVLKRLHEENIPLTEEIRLFLGKATKEYAEMKRLAIEKSGTGISAALITSPESDRLHAEALFLAAGAFYVLGDLPIPEEISTFFAVQEAEAIRLVAKCSDLTTEIRELFTFSEMRCQEFFSGLIDLHQAGIPFTKPVFDVLSEANIARMRGVSRAIAHLQRKKIPFTPKIHDLLKTTARLGLCRIIQEFLAKNMALSPEIRALLSTTYEARISTISLVIEEWQAFLSPQITRYIASNSAFSTMSTCAIDHLHKEGISLTPEIQSFLAEANRAHALTLFSESLRLVKEGVPFTEETIKAIYNKKGPSHWETPALALIYLQRAGISLNAIPIGKTMLPILWIVVRLGKNGILTQENLKMLLAGYGSRVPKILTHLKQHSEIDQKGWNCVIRKIEEEEWKPCANAAIVFGQRNRNLARNPTQERMLPPELIGEIASFLAPPGMTEYKWGAVAAAEREAERVVEFDNKKMN